MMFRVLARVAPFRVTLTYAVFLTLITATLYALGPQVEDEVIRHVSTNLHNLGHGHLGTLLSSAFVVEAGPIYVWLPGLVCVLALAELMWGSVRLAVAFATGHVGATLLVAAGLAAAVELGSVPISISHATDVGMSYGTAAVVGSMTAALPERWRPAWIGWWLAVAGAVVVAGGGFTEAGHAVALALGMVVSTRFGRPRRWTRNRLVVLGMAAAFGFLVVGSTDLLVATAAGLVGATLAECAVRLTKSTAHEASSAHRL